MIEVKFSCANSSQLFNEMMEYLNQIAPQRVEVDSRQMEFPNVAKIEKDPVPVEKKARKKREFAEGTVVKEHQAPEAEEAAKVEVKQVAKNSREAVHLAVQQVNVTRGLPIAREIITSFGAQRLSEIKEQDYSAFISKCNEALTT